MRWWSMQLPVNVLNRHLRLSRVIRKNVDEIAKSMKSGDAFPAEGELESNGPLCRILATSNEHARARAVNPRAKEEYFAILKKSRQRRKRWSWSTSSLTASTMPPMSQALVSRNL